MFFLAMSAREQQNVSKQKSAFVTVPVHLLPSLCSSPSSILAVPLPSHPSHPSIFSQLMPSEVAGPGRRSCKFTQQHTSLTGESSAPKIAQTAIGERGPKWWLPRTDSDNKKQLSRQICEPPSPTQVLLLNVCCAAILFLDLIIKNF